jgi:DNA polymerase III subunit beta
MRITALTGALNAALSLAAMSADRRMDTPLRIIADQGRVTFTCVNNRAAIGITTTASATVHQPGKGSLSTVRLAALLSGFTPRSVIDIATTETAATITCREGRYRLPLLADPPGALVIDPEIGRAELPAGHCMKLLEVLPAAETEQTRFYLCGIHLHNIGDQLIAAATDGAQLMRVAIPATHFSDDNRVIIPTRTAAILNRLLHETRPERVTLRRSRAVFAASWPGVEIVSGMIDAAFPDYRRAIPRGTGSVVICDRAALLASLNRLNAVATGDVPLLALAWTDGEPLRLFLARQPDDAADIVTAHTKGNAKIAVSLSRLAVLLGEFDESDILIEAADGGLLMREGGKLAVLISCIWNFATEEEAAA